MARARRVNNTNISWESLVQASKEKDATFLKNPSITQEVVNAFYVRAFCDNNHGVVRFLQKNNLQWKKTKNAITALQKLSTANKNTLLLWACTKGLTDLAEWLIANGADTKYKTQNRNALMYAAANKHGHLFHLFSQQQINTALSFAAAERLIKIQHYLLENGARWSIRYARTVLSAFKEWLSNSPASKLIGVALSPYRTYLSPRLLSHPTLEGSETYHRSEKSVLAKLNTGDPSPFYVGTAIKLTQGALAHAGCYPSSYQRIGDKITPSNPLPPPPPTTPGSANLYDALLKHSQQTCRYIIENMPKTNIVTVGFYNNYPCIMVLIPASTIYVNHGPSEGAFHEWVNFLISYFVGMVNHQAYIQHFPIELVRRSSFLFLSPSIAPTDQSIRISVGMIPKEYANILIQCLTRLNALLQKIFITETPLPPLSKDIFYASKSHIAYLNGKYDTPPLNNPLELLWQKVEKAGKTTVQNIMRTTFARDGIAAETFKALQTSIGHADADFTAFFTALNWAISKISIVKDKLSFNTSDTIDYGITFANSAVHSNDDSFWEIISMLVNAVKIHYGDNEILIPTIYTLEQAINEKIINHIYSKLEMLTELLNVIAIENSLSARDDEGHASDSDCEEVVEGVPLYSKKNIVSNGMRAIWAAIVATQQMLNRKTGIYLDSAYYEVELGKKLIAQLESFSLETKKTRVGANVILYDLNACLTTAVPNGRYKESDLDVNKILILDVTSATKEQKKEHVRKFARSRSRLLLLVSSGLKAEQCGGDKNSYGTVRVIAKESSLREQIYSSILKNEPPVLSLVSHLCRRIFKKIGAVPTNHSILFHEVPQPTIAAPEKKKPAAMSGRPRRR